MTPEDDMALLIQEPSKEKEAPAPVVKDDGSELSEDPFPKTVEIAGKSLRPLTLGSIQIMKKTGNKLILGVEVDDVADIFDDIVEFLYVQSVDKANAVKYCMSSEEDREVSRLEWSLEIDFSDMDRISEAVIGMIADANSTKVEGEPPEEMKKAKKSGND